MFIRLAILIGVVLLVAGIEYGGSNVFMGISLSLSLLIAAYSFGMVSVLRGGRPGPTLVGSVALLTSAAGLLGVQLFNWSILSAVSTFVSVVYETEGFIREEQRLDQLQVQEEPERRPFVRPRRKRGSTASSRMISAKRSSPLFLSSSIKATLSSYSPKTERVKYLPIMNEQSKLRHCYRNLRSV